MTNKYDYKGPSVQSFAFGGIANPSQRAFLRGSDQSYLAARQKELDAFEAERQAYNNSLNTWQNEVYNPYKSQVDEYNTAAERYNTDVYNPYKSEFAKYQEAVAAYNAGDRLSDYAGPAEPKLASEFSMQAPTAPTAFEMTAPTAPEQFKGTAPVLPFKEEDVVAYQEDASNRARQDASRRAVAIDVVSNPDQFNFGSMSVSNRFMAKGGEVKKDSAREMLDAYDPRTDPRSPQFIGPRASEIAPAAYTSAAQDLASADLRMQRPAAPGLPVGQGSMPSAPPMPMGEGSRPAAPQMPMGQGFMPVAPPAPMPSAPPQPAAPGPAPRPPGPSMQVGEGTPPPPRPPSVTPQPPMPRGPGPSPVPPVTRPDPYPVPPKPTPPPAVTTMPFPPAPTPPPPVTTMPLPPPEEGFEREEGTMGTMALVPWYNSKTGETYIASDGATKPPSSDWVVGEFGNNGTILPPAKKEQAPVTPAPTAPGLQDAIAELKKGDKRSAEDIMREIVGLPPLKPTVPIKDPTLADAIDALKKGDKRSAEDYMRQIVGLTPEEKPAPTPPVITPTPPIVTPPPVVPKDPVSVSPLPGPGVIGIPRPGGSPITPLPGPGTPPGQVGGGIIIPPINLNPRGRGTPPVLPRPGVQDPRTVTPKPYTPYDGRIPVFTSPRVDYTRRGVGAVGPIPVYQPPTGPMFGDPNARTGGPATDDSSYFARSPQTSTGLAPGSASIGSSTIPLAANKKTMDAIGANPNLSPTMLGGQGNAGIMYDRLGNPIYSPGVPQVRTFAKGGEAKKGSARAQMEQFKDGGQAKKANAKSASEPGIFSVRDYATETSAQMFPDQLGQDDERDAARHMLAAATMARKLGPGTAEFLGKAHERMSNPESFFSMLGIGKPRDDYEIDLHNNKLGVDLGSRATSQEDLERLVRSMAMQSQSKQTPGKPLVMSPEQMEARRKRAMEPLAPPPEYRAEGSPEEGEQSLDQYYAPKARPSSGLNRKQGPISEQLNSGEAYANVAKGLTELPYNLAGAPMDLVMMARQALTGQAPAGQVGTSDYIKSKMTELGIRPAPPTEPTAKGFYEAGDLLSNLTNPAGVTRAAAKGAKKTGEAATAVAKDFQEYNRQLSVPGASYAVRPTGSTMLTGRRGEDGYVPTVSAMDLLLTNGISSASNVAGLDRGRAKLIEDFWDKKARNYFERQFGTPNDPVMEGIKTGQIKGPTLSSNLQIGFPEHLIDSLAQGKTRYKEKARPADFVGPGAPEARFFPKFPGAVEDFTRRYDQGTGLKGNLFTQDPEASDSTYYNLLSDKGKDMARKATDLEEDKLTSQGLRPELINTEVETIARSHKEPRSIVGSGTYMAKKAFDAFEQAMAPRKTNEPEKTSLLDKIFSKSTPADATDKAKSAESILPENVITAFQKGEPVYDFGEMSKPLSALFKPTAINEYLATLSPRELANVRFEDAVRGGLKLTDRAAALGNVAERIKAGKPVADTVFSNGVGTPLLQIKEGPLSGFAFKRIEKREATVPEGAYVGHSVGGYETGGPTYTKEKRDGFNTGKWQVYTLRDNRNRPVNTIEVTMKDENTPIVTQIKGNGRATGNVPPEKYDGAILQFLRDYLKPAAIEEKDALLTPLLQNYKAELGSSPRTR